MRQILHSWKIRTSFLLSTILFTSLMIASNAMAASGYTWTNNTAGNSAMSGQNWESITSSSDGSHLTAIANGGDIWTSTNGGTSWTNDTAGNSTMSGQYWYSIASSSDGSHLTAVVFGGDVWASTSGGTSWTNDTTGNSAMSGQSWQSIASSSNGSVLAAVVFGGDIWTSTNGGLNWTNDTTGNSAMSGQNWTSIASSSDGSHLATVASGGDIWIAYDASLVTPVASSSNDTSNPSSSSNFTKTKAPNTGYGTPDKSNSVIVGLGTVALVLITGGLSLLYGKKRSKQNK